MIVDGAVAFVGPTLPKRARPEDARLEYRAPAMRGDVYRAALEDPRAILLIDGAFENSPAVFHKEILWALARVGIGWFTQGSSEKSVSSVALIGSGIFLRHAFAFEATSVLILVAMIGAVVLARREHS